MLSIPYPVILASASPRRKQLLNKLITEFDILHADLDEGALTTSDPFATAEALAAAKAGIIFSQRPDSLVIGGDTVVALPIGEDKFEQLAKPEDEGDAHRILRQLSGRTHLVITGIALFWPGGQHIFADTSKVTFNDLVDEQIWSYISTGEPMDKAGAYGAQDSSNGFIASIEGSFDNVVGLPTEALMQALQTRFGAGGMPSANSSSSTSNA
ncbi:MAG: septum formation protein Maf [Fimbriimonadaceae bacterium]|nr:septum formation protein Maf [Fimbriimonadaceae bacterium]